MAMTIFCLFNWTK